MQHRMYWYWNTHQTYLCTNNKFLKNKWRSNIFRLWKIKALKLWMKRSFLFLSVESHHFVPTSVIGRIMKNRIWKSSRILRMPWQIISYWKFLPISPKQTITEDLSKQVCFLALKIYCLRLLLTSILQKVIALRFLGGTY